VEARWQRAQMVAVPIVAVLAGLGLLTGIARIAMKRAERLAWAPVAALWMVLGLAAAEWQPSPDYPTQLMGYADNLSRDAVAHVVRVRPATIEQSDDADSVPPWEATEETAGPHRMAIDLEIDAIEDITPDVSRMVPVSGGVRVSLYGSEGLTLSCGDRVELPVRLRPPERYRDPGAFQYADFLLTQGIAFEANARAAKLRVTGSSPAAWRCRLYAAQAWASARMDGFAQSAANHALPAVLRLNKADTAMLNAMLFGDRAGLTRGLRVGFERTGSFHLFVVSGLHIALLAAGVFWILARLRCPPWLATLVTIAAACAFTALTGFGQPAQRSLAMTSVYLVARLMSRNRDSMNALGAAVLALLVWDPASLFEASFQMTALAIVAIAGIAVPLGNYTFLRYASVADDVFHHPRSHFEPHEMQLRVMLEMWGEAIAGVLGKRARRLPANVFRATLWAGELALVGTVAELVMVLPMAMYFHRATVFALPANMIVIPLIAVLAPLAVATFLGSLLSPWVALLPGAMTAAVLHGIAWAIHRVSSLEAADVRVPGPVWWVAALAVVAWLGCCWLVRRSKWSALAAAVAMPLVAAMVLWPEPITRTPNALEVTAIDVGQGDSLLAVNPEGSAMLIDAGGPIGRAGPAEVVSRFDVGEEVVSPYLWSRRIRRVDIVVLSHAHTDHMGGMPAILENFRPRELWVGADPNSALYAALLAEAARLGIVVRHVHAGDAVKWGLVEVTVLAPAAAYSNPNAPKNDDSVVLRMQYGKASALLEGDAETPSEATMLAAGLVHPVTLLKVGHHGSRTSTTQAFVDAAAPEDAVISVGRRNTFGHPRAEVIGRLAVEGAHVFRTDEFGLTSFLLTADGGIREIVDGVMLPQHKQGDHGLRRTNTDQSERRDTKVLVSPK
jgi:competence protein ComEC